MPNTSQVMWRQRKGIKCSVAALSTGESGLGWKPETPSPSAKCPLRVLSEWSLLNVHFADVHLTHVEHIVLSGSLCVSFFDLFNTATPCVAPRCPPMCFLVLVSSSPKQIPILGFLCLILAGDALEDHKIITFESSTHVEIVAIMIGGLADFLQVPSHISLDVHRPFLKLQKCLQTE